MREKKPIWKKWWFWTVIILLFVILASSLGGNDETTEKNENKKTEKVPENKETKKKETEKKETEKKETAKVKKYGNGTYLVNKDIEPGLYRVEVSEGLTNMAYFERSKDTSMEVSSILANIILTGDGYVEILPTDVAVKVTGAKIHKVDLGSLEKNIKTEATDGIYLIGYDLDTGTYKVEVTDKTTNMGYVERSKSVAMNLDDIIANEIIQGPGYVEIKEGDFAVRLQGVKITKQ